MGRVAADAREGSDLRTRSMREAEPWPVYPSGASCMSGADRSGATRGGAKGWACKAGTVGYRSTGKEEQMESGYTDQKGRAVSRETFFGLFSESILANVIAFEEAGVPRCDLKHYVSPEGGAVLARGMLFQTPTRKRLSEEEWHVLLDTYAELVGNYFVGSLDPDRVNRIRERNHVPKKAWLIRARLRGSV